MNLVLDEIKKINAFIREPVEFFSEPLSRIEKVRIFFIAFLYKLVVVCLFLAILYMVDKYLMVLRQPLLNMRLWVYLLFAIIVAPLLEELIFRLPLRYHQNWLWRKIERLFGLEPSVFWKKNYRYILYTCVLLFGVIHLVNYSNSEFFFYLIAPVIVGSQLFGGLILSYTRLKLGFWWSVVKHGLWNALVILLSLTFFHNKEVVRITEKDVNLSLHELGYLDKKAQSFKISRLENGLIDFLEVSNSSVQQLIDSLYLDDELKVLNDTWISLKLQAPEGYDQQALLRVLKEQYQITSTENRAVPSSVL
ncbi:CPBP family intramembrane glutamic endopeptidase [Olivibacter sp. XZL3]|uniref:CPBP family intramembrane glutamic endopeptidase n=1 Tax=Olivibacter sp. XZL3 TaxID=1735116 RepID=UPI0010664897|nr:CPBP family intramembrane glutamic endopeptidase [Olivibacter sp. XZL3]